MVDFSFLIRTLAVFKDYSASDRRKLDMFSFCQASTDCLFNCINKVFKFDSMWRGNKRIIFQIFSIQKITDMVLSNHNLSLCTKLITVLNKEDWQSMK